MNKNKLIIGAVSVATILALSSSAVLAATTSVNSSATNGSESSFKGLGLLSGLSAEERASKIEEMKETKDKILAAILAGDYDTWASLVSATRRGEYLLTKINKDNFAEFSKAHQLMKESRDIMDKLGVEPPLKKAMKGGKGMRGQFKKMMQNSSDTAE